MKVFYVMVLVLVAGAVPSHGRTETEGTVFNRTQPHESMNNVTVSSSKLETYHYSYFVMQWPRSFCNFFDTVDRQCYQVPDRFTVHGLWPQRNDGAVSRGVDCKSIGIYGNYRLFDGRQLEPVFVPFLNQYWPDLASGPDNNQYFWKYEYDKHGSCTFDNQNLYFYLSLTMFESLGELALKLSTIRRGRIIPSDTETYSVSNIKDAVHEVTSKIPSLQCINVRNRMQLLEIRFCVDRRGIGLNLIDCTFYSNCGNGRVYLPKP